MPFSTRAVIAIASYLVGAACAFVIIRRAGVPLAALAGSRPGAARRLLVPVAWLALAGRIGAALEVLAVAGLSLGLVTAQGQWSSLPAEVLVDGTLWLGAGYLLLYVAWRHVDWRWVAAALGWPVDRRARGLLFVAAGLYFSWPLRLPVDLAAAWVQLPTTRAFEAGWGPLGAAMVITAAGLVTAYALATYVANRHRDARWYGLLSETAGRGARWAVAVGVVGLLADGVASATSMIGTLMGNLSLDNTPQIAFGVATVAITYPLAVASAAGVRRRFEGRPGPLPATLLILTLAAHLAWPLDIAGRLYGMAPRLASGPNLGLMVLAAVVAVAAALAAADTGAAAGPPPAAGLPSAGGSGG